MHERRNMFVILVLIGAISWAFAVWVVIPATMPAVNDTLPMPLTQRITSLAIALVAGAFLLWALRVEDKLDNEIAKVNFGHYYEQDGLCLQPMIRVQGKPGAMRAEVCLYYQNRFSGPCEAVIHLRPPPGSIHSHPGHRDIHFAFNCTPGAYGVIHQPVAVSHEYQGMPVDIELAAAVRYPRGHGQKLRSKRGIPCGTFDVDWALAFRQSAHELSGEIELKNPAKVHMVLPEHVREQIKRAEYEHEVFSSPALT